VFKPKVLLVCYDFDFGISYEEEDVMFATKLDLFSIGTIEVPTHIELISKLIYILDLKTTKLIPKQPIELVCVIVVNLNIPPNNIKQHLPKTFFHPKVRDMIIDETFVQE
jgi:hypothetical protein